MMRSVALRVVSRVFASLTRRKGINPGVPQNANRFTDTRVKSVEIHNFESTFSYIVPQPKAFAAGARRKGWDLPDAPFGRLQGLPKGMKAVTSWRDRDAAWTEVASGIRKVVEKVTL